MKFYKKNIGDYQSATGHLSMLEHGAYNLLLDAHYSTEIGLPRDIKSVYRMTRAVSRQERSAVRGVLDEFWELTDDGWVNKRAMQEIEEYRRVRDAKRRGSAARWAKRRGAEPHADADADADATRASRARARSRIQNSESSSRGTQDSIPASTEQAEPTPPPPDDSRGRKIPPTASQLEFIASLSEEHGVEVETPATKQEAGRLIDRLKAGELTAEAKEGWKHLPGCAPPGDDPKQQWRRTPWEDMEFWERDILQQESRDARIAKKRGDDDG